MINRVEDLGKNIRKYVSEDRRNVESNPRSANDMICDNTPLTRIAIEFCKEKGNEIKITKLEPKIL